MPAFFHFFLKVRAEIESHLFALLHGLDAPFLPRKWSGNGLNSQNQAL